MTHKRKVFLIASSVFFLLFALVDLKNHLRNGALYIINDDLFDKIKFYMNLPGYFIGFLVIILVYHNIHNYDSYVLEAVTLVFSSVLYGWITSIISHKFISTRRQSKNNSTGGLTSRSS